MWACQRLFTFPVGLRCCGFLIWSAKEHEGFKVTIRWYLSWCARNSVGCSVQSAQGFVRAKNRKKIPLVMTKEETRDFFAQLKGEKLLMAKLQYAAELRVSERMRLRVQDLDLKRNQVVVRCGKGVKDRVAPLSEKLVADIEAYLRVVRALFEEDLQNPELAGYGCAESAGFFVNQE